MTDYTVYLIGTPIVLMLICIEAIFSSKNNLHLYKKNDSWGTIGLLSGNIIINILVKGSIFSFYLYLYQFRIFEINNIFPTWMVVIATLIAIDFVFYWYHRFSHRIRFLWAIHMNHHSSVEMNFLVSLRQAWFNPFARVPFFLFLPLIGFDPTITVVVGAAATLWAVIEHTQCIGKLGILEWFFVTPSAHRVHHGTNPEYLDKNYGNFFIIWDRMFGTYAEEKEPVIYGLKDNVNTFNPLKITSFSWKSFFKDFKKSKTFRDKILSFCGSPEWTPILAPIKKHN